MTSRLAASEKNSTMLHSTFQGVSSGTVQHRLSALLEKSIIALSVSALVPPLVNTRPTHRAILGDVDRSPLVPFLHRLHHVGNHFAGEYVKLRVDILHS